MEPIRIGGDLQKPHPTKPLTSLPARLTLEACLGILETYDPDLTATGIQAGRQFVVLEHVEDVIERSELSIEDRMRLKAAMVGHGIIMAGVKRS
jgi:hypothetical protein